MESKLVKILKGSGANVKRLNEENISEYVQAKNAGEAYKKLVIEPFEAYAKDRGEKTVFEIEDLQVALSTKRTLQKYSAKDTVELFESFLNVALQNNDNNRRMHGVKRFDGVVAADAEYLLEQMEMWQDAVLGFTESTSVKYKGGLVERIATENAPRLIMLDYKNGRIDRFTLSDVGLYIAASEQAKLIDKNIVKPFEKAFKANAEKDEEQTMFDTKTYGRLAVQVKTVPRLEPEYDKVREGINGILRYTSGLGRRQVDNMTTFYNEDLIQEKPYVSVCSLMDDVAKLKEQKELKYRQEISVLYMPEKAIVIGG
jgi:hypothetical protein